jgi:hypothetical protein
MITHCIVNFAVQLRCFHAGSYPYWVPVKFKGVYVMQIMYSKDCEIVVCMN